MALYTIDGTEIPVSSDGKSIDYVIVSLKTNPFDYDGTLPLMLLHYSDLHADKPRLESIMSFYTDHASKIDDIIDTGDTNYRLYSDDFSWFNTVSGSQNILRAVGNHEAFTNPAGGNQAMADVATKFIDPYISNWNVLGHTAGTTYYYKDYTSQKIRLIVLDGNNSSDATQLSWLESVLADAITNEYHVVVANHYAQGKTADRVESSFSPLSVFTTASNSSVPANFVSKISTFINNGGVFIGHLAGHLHTDVFGKVNDNQYCFGVTCATNNAFQNEKWSDLNRFSAESADAFNLVAIDSSLGTVKIYRIGANMDVFGRARKSMCYDYINHTILYD